MLHRDRFIIAIATVITLLSITSTSAQELLYDVKLDGYFDNREYNMGGSIGARSGSDFAVRLAPTLGFSFWEGNSINAGVDMMQPLGGEPLLENIKAVIFYAYDSAHWSAAAGVFSRDRMMRDDYSTAFYTDDYLFNDDLIEGLMARYFRGESYIEAVCDWEGQPSVDRREKFRLLSSARRYWDKLYIGYNLSITHFAGADNEIFTNVVDNVLVNPCVGARWEWDDLKLNASLSYLQSLQQDRSFEEGWQSPAMGEAAFRLEYKGFSLDERFYFGDDIMPLYDGHTLEDGTVMEYGELLYTGDPFFRAVGGFYNRAALRYDRSFFKERMRIRAEFVTHANGDGVGYEQIVSLNIRFGGKLIKNIKLD